MFNGLLGATGVDKGLHGVTRGYQGLLRLQGARECYKGLPGVTTEYKGIQGVTGG